MAVRHNVAALLTAAREARGETQAAVARHCGVTRGYWHDIERGHRLPSIAVLEAAITFLAMDPDTVYDSAGRFDPALLAYLYETPAARELLTALKDQRAGNARVQELVDGLVAAKASIPYSSGGYRHPYPEPRFTDPFTVAFADEVRQLVAACLHSSFLWYGHTGGDHWEEREPREGVYFCHFCGAEDRQAPERIVHLWGAAHHRAAGGNPFFCPVVRMQQVFNVLHPWLGHLGRPGVKSVGDRVEG